jgi:DNA-binding IclR family transcriptional regulator
MQQDAGMSSLRLVPAVERTVRVLDLLAGAGKPLSLAEIARSLELPRSSLHGLLATLVHLDLARRDDDACFRSGARPVQWAGAWNGQAEVTESFQRQAQTVAALASETVMLAALDGTEVVYLACRPGQRALEINFRVGGRLPAAIASSGKAMLATLSDARVRQQLAGHRFDRITRHSVSSLSALLKQLRHCRAVGLAIDDEEAAEGMLCLGAAILAPGTGRMAGASLGETVESLESVRSDLSLRSGRAAGPVAAEAARHAVAVSVIKAGLSARRRRELEQGVKSLAAAITAELSAGPALQSGKR